MKLVVLAVQAFERGARTMSRELISISRYPCCVPEVEHKIAPPGNGFRTYWSSLVSRNLWRSSPVAKKTRTATVITTITTNEKNL